MNFTFGGKHLLLESNPVSWIAPLEIFSIALLRSVR